MTFAQHTNKKLSQENTKDKQKWLLNLLLWLLVLLLLLLKDNATSTSTADGAQRQNPLVRSHRLLRLAATPPSPAYVCRPIAPSHRWIVLRFRPARSLSTNGSRFQARPCPPSTGPPAPRAPLRGVSYVRRDRKYDAHWHGARASAPSPSSLRGIAPRLLCSAFACCSRSANINDE